MGLIIIEDFLKTLFLKNNPNLIKVLFEKEMLLNRIVNEFNNNLFFYSNG